MNFSLSSLMVGLVVSTVGYAFFGWGRRQQRASAIVGGLALMAFPYFVPGVGWTIAIAIALLGLLALALKLGL